MQPIIATIFFIFRVSTMLISRFTPHHHLPIHTLVFSVILSPQRSLHLIAVQYVVNAIPRARGRCIQSPAEIVSSWVSSNGVSVLVQRFEIFQALSPLVLLLLFEESLNTESDEKLGASSVPPVTQHWTVATSLNQNSIQYYGHLEILTGYSELPIFGLCGDLLHIIQLRSRLPIIEFKYCQKNRLLKKPNYSKKSSWALSQFCADQHINNFFD